MENIISPTMLNALGNIATILLFLITISSYFFVPKILKEKKEIVFRISLTLLIIALLYTFWKWEWLGWLFIKLQIPVWQIIVLDVGILLILMAIIFDFLREGTPASNTPPKYFSLHGARWYFDGGRLDEPPICEKCLMEMHGSGYSPYNSYERWVCRECGYEIMWDSSVKGRLISDVRVRYNAQIRRKFES